MLFVTENSYSRQLELLAFVASTQPYYLTTWIYPESRSKSLYGLMVSSNYKNLESVTSYNNGHIPRCSVPQTATPQFILNLKSAKKKLNKHVDSIALYRPNEKKWVACSVGHEGICLVREASLKDAISNSGFNVSDMKPHWW